MPPSPLRSDDFFSEGDASVESPSRTTLTRPSDLSLTQTTSTSSSDPPTVVPGPGSGALAPPIAGPEDSALTGLERGISVEGPDNDRMAEKRTEGEVIAGRHVVLKSQRGSLKEDATSHAGLGNGREEEEEMTQERLRSLLEDIKLEGGMEDEEITEERVNAILEQVRQAEKDMSSVAGWRSETSGAMEEPAAACRSPNGEEGRWDFLSYVLLALSPEVALIHLDVFRPLSPDSLADSLEQRPAQNGDHTPAAMKGKEKEAKKMGHQEDSSTAGPGRGGEKGGDRSQHKVQVSLPPPTGTL